MYKNTHEEYLDILEEMLEGMGVSREIIDFAERWKGKNEKTLKEVLWVETDFHDFDQLDFWNDGDFYCIEDHRDSLWLIYRGQCKHILRKEDLLRNANVREREVLKNVLDWEPFPPYEKRFITLKSLSGSVDYDIEKKIYFG